MLPLRFVAETFGYAVTWNGSKQSITVSKAALSAVFTVDSSVAVAGGQTVDLKAPVVAEEGSVYVPARVFCQLLGCFLHYYDRTNGEYLLMTDYPVSAGDRAGMRNADFDSSAQDPELLRFRNAWGDSARPLEIPVRAEFADAAIQLGARCRRRVPRGRHARADCRRRRECLPPLALCAGCLSDAVDTTPEGALSVTSGKSVSVFPLVSGYYIRDGKHRENTRYATVSFDGAVYTTIEAFADATGITCYKYDAETWVLTRYNLSQFDNLYGFAAESAEELSSLHAVRGYIA